MGTRIADAHLRCAHELLRVRDGDSCGYLCGCLLINELVRGPLLRCQRDGDGGGSAGRQMAR